MRAQVLASLVLAVLVGCGPRPRAQRPGRESLQAIRIEGNRAISDDALVPGLVLDRTRRAGRALDPYQLTVDTARIRAAYVRLGFFDVEVTARVDNQGTAQTVVFTVVEGTRATLQVVFRGLPPDVPLATARALIPLPDGAPFEYAAYDAAKLPLVALLENAGYAHVQIDAAVLADRARGIATARFAIDAGPRAQFGLIAIEGVRGDLVEAIRGRLAFRAGDPYSAAALLASQRALYELGRFSTVRIEQDRSGGGAIIPVRISVTRTTRREVRLGFGMAYDPVTWKLRGRGGYSVVPEHHPLWTLATDARPAISFQHDTSSPQLELRFLASAHRLDLFWPRVRGELELSVDYLEVEAFTSAGPRARAGVSSPLGARWLQARVGWLLENLWFSDIHVLEPERTALHLDEPQRRGAYELSMVADLRDDPLQPTRGAFASVRAALGTPAAGGADSYLQVTPELRGYVPLGRLVLAARGRLGLLRGTIPVTERYFSGGSSNHRGFPDRRLSPTAAATFDGEPARVVVGGAALLEAGVELRIPLGTVGFPVGTQLFLDGGDVTPTIAELDPAHLHWAGGFGLYVQVLGLKIRGDVGLRLNRTGPGEPDPGSGFWGNLTWHFGIGDTY